MPTDASAASGDARPAAARLGSVDAMRGATVGLMILVNNPGSWAHVLPPLRHAEWHGLTPTDLVFPFFLHIVGVSLAISAGRRLAAGASPADLRRHVVRRAAIIIGLGLLLNAFPFGVPLSREQVAQWTPGDLAAVWTGLRLPGVLQRIGLCYLVAGLVVITGRGARPRRVLAAALVLATLYELVMRLPLVAGWGAGSFARDDNMVRWLDLRILGPRHMLGAGADAFDPEGLLSTLTATVTVLAGHLCAPALRQGPGAARRLTLLAGGGAAATLGGWTWGAIEPVNKQLWTTSYVILAAGLAAVSLALAAWIIDQRGWRRWAVPALVLGSNPLLAFLGSGVLARLLHRVRLPDGTGGEISLQRLLLARVLEPWAGADLASLLYAAGQVALWVLILRQLHRRGIHVRI